MQLRRFIPIIYIANKSELTYHGIGKSEEEIRQVLKDAELYEDEEEVDLDETMFNDQSNDDLEVIAEEPLEIEKTLDLSRFSQNAISNNGDNNRELEDEMNEPVDLKDFNQEEDYNPAELVAIIFVIFLFIIRM